MYAYRTYKQARPKSQQQSAWITPISNNVPLWVPAVDRGPKMRDVRAMRVSVYITVDDTLVAKMRDVRAMRVSVYITVDRR
jgi:hypothetical protein